MSTTLRMTVLLAVAVAACMLIPVGSSAASAGTPHGGGAVTVVSPHPAMPASSAAAHASRGALSTQERIVSALKSDNVPMNRVFLPNFNSRASALGGVVSPLYNVSPAPMGLGDFGIQDVGGSNVGTISYTPSIEGSATLNAVDPLYVTSSAPDEFTIQLNTVLNHVDILGNTNYNYWIQNVPFYAAGSQTLSFENNIWNFSSPATFMGYNAIYSGHGSIVGGGLVYIAGGPSFHVPTPFTVSVFNNASVVNDRPTVYFNYSVTDGLGTISGSFDQVEFNSSATPPVSPAPAPTFQIDGQSVNPTGFLLNDAEIMLGGPGGGSTTTLFNIEGSMGLWLMPNGTSTYQTVPAAFDFGTDTGETSEGIAEASTTGPNAVATLGPGPSILYPLWGVVGAHPGAEKITVNLHPTNAFVFANAGNVFNESVAAWGPTPVKGPAVFTLSPQQYTFEFLLADHNPVTSIVPSGTTYHFSVTLALNPSLGVYTPLWAEANSQLAAISIAGSGTVASPYVLDNQPAVVSPLFGQLNDYVFPVFPGVYLIDTTAYVDAINLPQFFVSYLPIEIEEARLVQNGLPLSNDLNLELYNASHVSIVAGALSGWSATFGGFGDPASVYLWNSSHDLIDGNTFLVQSNGITTSGGGHNTIWGNEFLPASNSGTNPGAVLNYGLQFGLNEFESNDLIYNNEFLTPITATLFPVNFYNGVFEPFTDSWNVAVQPATNVRVVNGWDLAGSILGLSWQGGNYWDNYGTPSDPYGVLPYNNGGFIWTGGDYHPLIPFVLLEVRFGEAGLPKGTAWSVTLNGYTQTTTHVVMTFWEPVGTYAFTVGPIAGYTPSPASGTEIVGAHWVFQAIYFT